MLGLTDFLCDWQVVANRFHSSVSISGLLKLYVPLIMLLQTMTLKSICNIYSMMLFAFESELTACYYTLLLQDCVSFDNHCPMQRWSQNFPSGDWRSVAVWGSGALPAGIFGEKLTSKSVHFCKHTRKVGVYIGDRHWVTELAQDGGQYSAGGLAPSCLVITGQWHRFLKF